MVAARLKADGVAKLLIEAKADLDAKSKVRPWAGAYVYLRGGWLVGGRAGGQGRAHERRMHACMHACTCSGAVVARSLGTPI